MTAHGLQTPRGHAVWRGLVLFLVVLASVALAAPRALAVEEATPAAGAEEERLTYEQLRNSSSQRAQEFFPEPYEEPSFFQWISFPVLIAGLVIALVLLGAYLWWQPKFAAERRQKQRR
jgi:4-amino-4-deoxy-L-arabinose transferase-like glycosyltransferase